MEISLILLIVVLVVSFFVLILFSWIIYKKNQTIKKSNLYKIEEIKTRNELLTKKEEELNQEQKQLFLARQENRELKKKYENLIDLENTKLEDVAKMSLQDAKDELLLKTKKFLQKDTIDMITQSVNQAKEEVTERSADILLSAMERIAETFSQNNTTSTINLKDATLKGKVIGKEGRNRAAFERITGTSLLVDTSETITISSFNPIRREIAKRTMLALIDSRSIQPVKIEAQYDLTKKLFDQDLLQIAKEALDKIKIYDLDPELYPLIGMLKFRTSYGQDVLTHSIECALLAERIAGELNLDAYKAKKIAFLHDIGKSRDYENTKDHVEEGLKIAQEFKLDKDITESIQKHHSSNIEMSKYVFITKVVDTISASRPGARLDSSEKHFERLMEIEKICNEMTGVKNTFALQSGREIRVMVEPTLINDEQSDIIALNLKEKIKEKNIINGKVNITVIREYRRTETIND